MDDKFLCTVIPNDCELQALTYFLDKREIKEPLLKWGAKWGQTMPAYSLLTWNNRSENSAQDSPLSCTRDTLMTSLEQRRVEETEELEAFIEFL